MELVPPTPYTLLPTPYSLLPTHRLHAVIDSQSRRHFAARGVDVQDYGLAEILQSQEKGKTKKEKRRTL